MIIRAPEIATRFRAGLGGIVTEWHASAAEARAEYYRLAREAQTLGFSPVMKRGGRWGWFLYRYRCQPTFIAYSNVHTKREAVERRAADMTVAPAAVELIA